jgi:hypothetical protein
MAHTLTLASIAGSLAAVVIWLFRALKRDDLRVTVRLDRSAPGAHLIWDIENVGPAPVTLTKLIVRSRTGSVDAWTLQLPRILAGSERILLPTDVDWSVLGARSIAVGDAAGGEHPASREQLVAIQEHLHDLVDRRAYTPSARDWLFGAANLAFGVVILGLGFFMLMWALATG